MRCQMTSICSGRGFIFVGDDFGRIHFVNRRMEVQTIKLFEGSVEQITQVCIKELIGKSVEIDLPSTEVVLQCYHDTFYLLRFVKQAY